MLTGHIFLLIDFTCLILTRGAVSTSYTVQRASRCCRVMCCRGDAGTVQRYRLSGDPGACLASRGRKKADHPQSRGRCLVSRNSPARRVRSWRESIHRREGAARPHSSTQGHVAAPQATWQHPRLQCYQPDSLTARPCGSTPGHVAAPRLQCRQPDSPTARPCGSTPGHVAWRLQCDQPDSLTTVRLALP